MFWGYHHLRKHPYNQIQSVKLQKLLCQLQRVPRGPGLRTYGPTVVPPHRWRWLKHWSSCSRCNEHKKCGDDPRQELEDFCPPEMDKKNMTWKVACGHSLEMIFFWIRGEGGSSLKSKSICKWMLNHKISVRRYVLTSRIIPLCLASKRQYCVFFLARNMCNMILCVLPILIFWIILTCIHIV